jgi:hypothetical protein
VISASPDGNHLPKFVTASGLALLATTYGTAGLLFRQQAELLVPQSELANLTPDAQEAIGVRQGHLLDLSRWLPWIVLGLTGLALVMIISGGIWWWRRIEKLEDQSRQAQVDALKRSVVQLSPQESLLRAEAEVDADLVDEEANQVAGGPRSASTNRSEEPREAGTPQHSADQEFRKRLIKSQTDTERKLASKLREAFPNHLVRSDAAAVTESGELVRVDAVVIPSDDTSGHVIELKVARRNRNLRRIIQLGMMQVSEAAAAITRSVSGTTMGATLVLVLDGDEDLEINSEIRHFAHMFALTLPVHVTFAPFTREEFEALSPQQLRLGLGGEVP